MTRENAFQLGELAHLNDLFGVFEPYFAERTVICNRSCRGYHIKVVSVEHDSFRAHITSGWTDKCNIQDLPTRNTPLIFLNLNSLVKIYKLCLY